MLTRLACLLSAAALVGLCACDPPDDPEGTTTDMSSGGMTTSESGGSGADTGEPEGCTPPSSGFGVCAVDEDCAIAGDCCGCIAFAPASGSPGNCGGSCMLDKCEEWGISEAACVDGRCAGVGLSCNQALVICDAIAPNCDTGTLPQVWGGCYTGECLPLEACDWAPSCETCGGDQLCMHETRGGCDYVRCVDRIPECQNAPSNCCTGSSWCGGGSCMETAEGFSCG